MKKLARNPLLAFLARHLLSIRSGRDCLAAFLIMRRTAKTRVSVNEVALKVLGAENVAALKTFSQDIAEEARRLRNKYLDSIRNLPYEPPVWKEGEAVHEDEDLRRVPLERQYLSVSGKTKNLSRLAEFPRLEYLNVSRANDRATAHLRGLNNIVSLHVRLGTYTDLSWSASMTSLRDLIIDLNVKLASLSGLEKLRSLRTLGILGLRRLSSIDPIASLTGLIGLRLKHGYVSGMPDRMHIKSIRAVCALVNLQMLNLAGVEIADGDITPIASLTNLEKVSVSPNFEIKQMALLAASFPPLFELWSKPLMESHRLCRRCGERKVRIIGPEVPDWCPACHKAKIEERLGTFTNFVEQYHCIKSITA